MYRTLSWATSDAHLDALNDCRDDEPEESCACCGEPHRHNDPDEMFLHDWCQPCIDATLDEITEPAPDTTHAA